MRQSYLRVWEPHDNRLSRCLQLVCILLYFVHIVRWIPIKATRTTGKPTQNFLRRQESPGGSSKHLTSMFFTNQSCYDTLYSCSGDDAPLPWFKFWQDLADSDPTSALAEQGVSQYIYDPERTFKRWWLGLAMNGGGDWQGGLDLLKKQAAEYDFKL